MKCWVLCAVLCFSLSIYGQDTEAYRLGVEGIQAIESGDEQTGLKLLKKAWALEPGSYDYPLEIGRTYLKAGDARKAEKHLYPLQFHADVQADLYLLLAQCYAELNKQRKNPDPEHRKELDALRYGIQKLPAAGQLYLQLAKRNMDLERPAEALATLEKGIANAPNFADNYFWAAKLLKAMDRPLWTWIYSEVFYNLSDDIPMSRSASQMIIEATGQVFSHDWKAEPEQMEQELRHLLSSRCSTENKGFESIRATRTCLLENWADTDFPISVLIDRMKQLQQDGLLEPYLASIYLESDKTAFFLPWLAKHVEQYERYQSWRTWNPIRISSPIKRL